MTAGGVETLDAVACFGIATAICVGFASEVEAVLLAHPAVAEAAVLAMPHPELGEDVAAFIALRPDYAATVDELIAHCRDRLAAFKYPRRLIVLDALPKSPTGKVLKTKLSSKL